MAEQQPVSAEEDAQQKDELKKLLDEADAQAMAEGAPDAPNAMEGAEMADAGAMEQQEGEMEEAEGMDLSPLTEELGATEERAQALYNAAQEIPKLAGKTPQELADMIAEDFDVLMQLEMVAARGEGGAMGGPPAGEQMAGGPMGMPPGDMMPPEGM
jgi:hypothetical protein